MCGTWQQLDHGLRDGVEASLVVIASLQEQLDAAVWWEATGRPPEHISELGLELGKGGVLGYLGQSGCGLSQSRSGHMVTMCGSPKIAHGRQG